MSQVKNTQGKQIFTHKKLWVGHRLGRVLMETFAAPLSGSYVISTDKGELVLREKGNYESIDLSNLTLEHISLAGANLRNANLMGADLTCVNFKGADLSGANLSGAIINSTNFDNANMENTRLQDVKFTLPPTGIDINQLEKVG